jgi:hypothetical protein
LIKKCWNYQDVYQRINFLTADHTHRSKTLTQYRKKRKRIGETLKNHINDSKLRKKIFDGMEHRLMWPAELVKFKGIDEKKFQAEYTFFSQFAHSTAFANSFIGVNGISADMYNYIYDRIVAYVITITSEALQELSPQHPQLNQLKQNSDKAILRNWF